MRHCTAKFIRNFRDSQRNSRAIMTTMNILHVCPTFFPATYWGGPIYSTQALCHHISGLSNVRLRVLTTDAAGPRIRDRLKLAANPAEYSNGYEVYYCRRIYKVSVSIELLGRLREMIKWSTVVHLTGVYSFTTMPTLILCRLYGKPVLWSGRGALKAAHDWQGFGKGRAKGLWEAVCNALRPVNTMAHVTSEAENNATLARMPGLATVVIPNGIDMPAIKPSRGWKPDGVLRASFVGRIDRIKAIENLIKAVSVCTPKVELKVYGTGDAHYVRSLRRLVEELKVTDSVFFCGHVNDEDKEAAFRTTDVCIVPSHSENFSMVVVEALSRGVPVIVSTGAPWASVEIERCGLWVDNSPDSLARAINRMDTVDLQEMGERGRAWMERSFDWDSISRSFYRCYRELAKSGNLNDQIEDVDN